MTEEKQYPWTDDPTINGVSDCDTDILNDCLMHLKYENTNDAIQNMYMTGQVEKQTRGLLQLCNMSHSTFDRSKFTVVGSPNITDDGIASGFSGSNYLTINTTGFFDDAYKFEVDSCAIYTSDTTEQQEIWEVEWRLRGRINYRSNKHYFDFYVPNGTTFKNTTVALEDLDFTDGDKIYSKCISNGLSSRTLIISKDGENWHTITNTDTVTASISGITTNTMKIGWYSSTVWWLTSIDLKQFSITADGVEVFSGNKTGIDTIKPDDYTTTSTPPTITDNGIASGFSSNQAIKTSSLNFSNPFELEVQFELTTVSGLNTVIGAGGNSQAGLQIATNRTSATYILLTDSSGTQIGEFYNSNKTGQTFQLRVKYTLKFSWSGTQYIIRFYDDNGTLINEKITDSSSALRSGTICIGGTISDQIYAWFKGNIDLNTFKFISNGSLAYQPCLKIPYTESKTGSKIVDSIYRDRVADMSAQFGYANYYTLDEDNGNFTLPQVELYGYIEKRARDIAHPVAQPFYRFSDEINDDEVRLEGAEVDKGLYLAIEQDPYLSALCTAGSTNDKICLPDFRNRVIYGDVASGYVEPELPNITGGYKHSGWSGADYFGAVTGYSVPYYVGTDMGQSTTNGMNFDASRSSSIYKDGGTVKTAGVKARWLCRWK